MVATREQILEVVLRAVKDDQEAMSAEPVELTEDTRPLEDLPGFDSLTSVVITERCLSALGVDDEITTLFIGKDESGKRFARTLRDVVDHLSKLESVLEARSK